MNLPFLDKLRKQEKKEFFLALLLRDESINAVIFEESLGKVRVIGKQEENFAESISSASQEELLDTADKAISKAEESLPENIETHKTIYGVKEDWVEDARIKKEFLAKLKVLSNTLELSPIGFIVIHEAIAHLLQEQEGAPVSAILVEIGKKDATVSILRAGKISETKKATIEDSITKTIDKILHHFTSHDILPSRIIVFNGKSDETLSQEFIGHTWSKSLPFLHVPQIAVLPNGFDARAVLFGAATQMGFEVLGGNEKIKTLKQPTKNPLQHQEKELTPKNKEGHMLEKNDFGFVQGKDIAYSKKEREEKPEQDEQLEETASSDFDFAETDNVESPAKPSIFKQNQEPLPNERSKKLQLGFLAHLPIELARKTLNSFSHIASFGKIAGKKIIIAPVVIIGIFILIALLYIYTMKATIVLTITPEVIEENKEITFSTNASSDFPKGIIAGEILAVTQEGEMSTPATGKKEIGEKAKGEVTIYNSDLSEKKNFSKDTLITSSNGLKFILDDSIQIASASGDASSITASTAKVSVTAEEVGKEFNLPSEAKFTVGSQDTSKVIAKNEKAFSGGSKKEITVVAQKDLDYLAENLPKRLETKAKEEIAKKATEDKTPLPLLTNISLTKKTFTKKVGEETTTIGITGTVTYETIMYKKSDIQELSENLLADRTKDKTVSEDGITFEIKDVKEKNKSQAKATIMIQAQLLPTIKSSDIAKEIAGKSNDDAQKILREIPQVASVVIKTSLKLPFLPSILPRKADNIEIISETE